MSIIIKDKMKYFGVWDCFINYLQDNGNTAASYLCYTRLNKFVQWKEKYGQGDASTMGAYLAEQL